MSDLALLILRATTGSFLAGHGAQKLFGSFEGPGIDGFEQMTQSMQLEPARAWAMAGGVSEFGGGVLTALGLLNPVGPLGIIGAMSMASRTAHRGQPIWVTEGGAELPVTNIAIATALMLAGPGKFSLDRLFGIRLPRWVAVIGLVIALLTVASQTELPEEGADEEEA